MPLDTEILKYGGFRIPPPLNQVALGTESSILRCRDTEIAVLSESCIHTPPVATGWEQFYSIWPLWQ